VVSFSASAGVQPLEERFTVRLDGPAAVWMTCTSPDDPDELHLVESADFVDEHELILRGVLAATTYQCEVRPLCGGTPQSAEFTSGTPSGIPQFSVTQAPGAETSGAYTVFNSQDGCFGAMMWILLTDPEGRVRWMYPVGEDLLNDVDVYLMGPDRVHVGGGWGLMDEGAPNRGVFRDIDLSGSVLVERTEPDFGIGFNHHSEPLDDGTYVSLTGHDDGDGARDWHGVGIELWSEADGVVWSWDSQALVDAGYIPAPDPWNEDLPYHANAVAFVEDALGSAVWVSNYGMEEIWRVDRGTGELTHVFGQGGDFTLAAGEWPSVQHGVDYQDDRMLVYDNGQDSNQSRIVEYRVDLGAATVTELWEWTEAGWYDPILGDADYLPNGNVLVTQGYNQCITPFGGDRSELLEIVPPDEVIWRLTWPSGSYSVYRAERYDGCDVFGNARYCPAIADRIADLQTP
jgi:hypothetical protein